MSEETPTPVVPIERHRFLDLVGKAYYWRLAVWKCASDALIAGAMVYMAAIADKEWTNLSYTAKQVIVISTVVAMLKVVNAFLDTTIQVLKDQQKP